MKKYYPNYILFCILLCCFTITTRVLGQSFDQSPINFNGLGDVANGITSLMYGPDGRLYIAEYPGLIKVLTIARNTSTDYEVTAMEVLDGIQTMADHNDDGSPYASVERETIGLTVVGTAANPVIYVTSSDFRIGAGTGGGNGDVDLDTNSGVITRFTWNGTSWDVVDIVRGLPRSEENHATNGLEFATINGTDYLIVASGGHTNAGGPSTNFVYTCEYALSAAILSVNLDMIESMPILNDNGRSYIYDLPTLDDPTRVNVNSITDPDDPLYDGIDVNDPWGGNDGLNQAIVVPGGPVQIYSPGYRNSYDIVLTESGALYASDNGANQGWGGFPVNEGGGLATNEYDPDEPGSQELSGGEAIDNVDHLELITTDIQTYVPGSFYAGHPNPIRANPTGAGLYTDDDTSAVFRTLTYDPDGSTPGSTTDPSIALPANWPPVQIANPVEGDWLGPTVPNPDGSDDNPVTTWGTNTNAVDEYTASNFGGAMQGDLIAGKTSGVLRRVQLEPDGTLQQLTKNFLSGIGGNVLGVTCNSDSEIFPGTIWAGTLDGDLVVFEPVDFIDCTEPGQPGYDPAADGDFDGYLNQDEVDNETAVCNGGSQPQDWDKVVGGNPLISDLNDTDDDADGISDANDPFQLGNPSTPGSDAFVLPVSNDLFNSQQGLGGYLGLGMTGLMNNGDTGNNWLDWLDVPDAGPNPNDVLGGAPGIMTSHMTEGTAMGTTNNQDKGYQYGVQVDNTTGKFLVVGGMNGFTGPLRLYENTNGITGGELGFFIGDGTQSNYIKFVVTTDGFTALQEIDDVPDAPIQVSLPMADRPSSSIRFYFMIDPATGIVELEYQIDTNPRTSLGSITALGTVLQAIQTSGMDLAVGFIGTSNTPGKELEGSWDFLNVLSTVPSLVQELPDLNRIVNADDENIDLNDYFDDENGVGNITYTVEANSDPSIGALISDNILTLSYPSTPAFSSITIRATDTDNLFVEDTFTVVVTESAVVLYRVNAGGSEVVSIDGDINWEEDTTTNNSQYLTVAGSDHSYSGTISGVDASVDTSTTPLAIFDIERSDLSAGSPNMLYSFPVSQPGNYEVRLYMANGFSGTSELGERIFDVNIEGISLPLLDDIDLSGTYGNGIGTMITHTLSVTDGSLDIEFLHGSIENPLINGIEILDAPNSITPVYVYAIANQFSKLGEELNGNLGVQAIGGDGNLTYGATGLPPGITIEPTNGQIGGTVNSGANTEQPYLVTITVDDSDAQTSDAVIISFNWTISSGPGPLLWLDKNEDENYTGRHECSFVQAGDKFYLMGGRESSTTLDVYDYTSDSWTSLVGSAPLSFNHFQAIEYQGLIWVIGGFGDNNFPNEVPLANIWIFDPSNNEWIQGPEIPTARQRGSTGLSMYNNKFYITGGNTAGHSGGYVAWFDEFDPATGVWTPLADAPRPRDHFHSAVIGDKIYIAGGRLSGGTGGTFKPTIAEVDVYDFSSGTWSTLPFSQNIPTPRGGAATVNFNDKLVVIGGEVEDELVYGVSTDDALKITEEYDPVGQTWTRLADMNFERHGTQAIVSGEGVFVTAGSPARGGGNQKNMEVLGTDAPQGTPSASSTLSVPSTVQLDAGNSTPVDLDVSGGNTGVLITAMNITGPDAADFTIVSGALSPGLINANSMHTLTLLYNGSIDNAMADLVIDYGSGGQLKIGLEGNQEPVVLWLEDFEDLSNGITVDNGATAWTSTRDSGIFEVTDGRLRINDNSTNPGVWTSEVISINGTVSLSVDVDDGDDSKETSDFVKAFYILDGGSPVEFGFVSGDISPLTFTAGDLTGSTIQIVIEADVSWNLETYFIDNIIVFGESSGGTSYALTINSGSGDGTYLPGTVVNITADPAPVDQQFEAWTGDVAAVTDVNSASTTVTMPSSDVSITATYGPVSSGGVLWLEDFEGLSNGTTVDNGATAWISTRDSGVFEVTDGRFRVNDNSVNPCVWTSEVISINGTVSLSVDVDDDDDSKETSDFVKASYILDGGSPVEFGYVSDDIVSPLTFTASNLTGSTIQIVIEADVSWNLETYFIDNVTVLGESSGGTTYALTVNGGSGDGNYQEGTVVNITADPAPNGQQFEAWTGDVVAVADVNSLSTTVTMSSSDVSVTATYSPISTGDVLWLEDFEDLSNGTVVDNGATAWTSTRDFGTFEVTDGRFRTNGDSYLPGVWTSEVIPINGTVSISVDVDDDDDEKETTDFVRALYILDGGAPVEFGFVSDDIVSPQTFTASDLTGSTIQIVIEVIVSWTAETYFFDNVAVYGDPSGTPQYALTVNSGIGDGLYEDGAIVNITADTAPVGEQFEAWTGDIASVADINSASTTITMPSSNVILMATYSPITSGGVLWLEDFEDISNGTIVENGATAWTSTRDFGTFEVTDGRFRTNGDSYLPGVWTSEVIPINGTVSLSVDVDDGDNEKEPNDFVRAYYILDGGNPVEFGFVADDMLSPQTFTVSNLTGSTIQIVIEAIVSWTAETYFFDNVLVFGDSAPASLSFNMENISGDLVIGVESFVMHPNPAKDVFFIEMPNGQKGPLEVQMFDLNGKMVRSYLADDSSNMIYSIQVDLIGLETGLYTIFLLNTGEGKVVYKAKLIVNN